MRRAPWTLVVSLAVLTLHIPAAVKAAEPEIDAPDQDPLISGGTTAQNCQWPTATALLTNSLCSGTLIHPQIVATAAHCPYVNQMRFGESADNPDRVVNVDFCLRNPDYDDVTENGVNGTDYAFCKLAQPIYDIPITPPMYGCELDMLLPGEPTMIVGFGNNQGNNGAGPKRWAQTMIQTPVLDSSEIVMVGEVGTAGCGGDSGGPAYFQFPDGSWHAYGIVSGGPDCGTGPDTYSLISRAVPFIEANSGIDVTPCHDVDGTWNPTAACGGFATTPTNTSVSWNNWCSTPLSGLASTCGPAFGSPPDNNPPTVAIVSPTDGAMLNPGETYDIVIDAQDPEFGVVGVELMIDGELVASDGAEPWLFVDATFGNGTYELVAVAEDHGGNVSESAMVTVIVGEGGDPGDGDGDPGDGDGDTGDGDTGGTDSGDGDGDIGPGFPPLGPGFEQDPDSCACSSDPSNHGAPLALGLGLLICAGLRRRR